MGALYSIAHRIDSVNDTIGKYVSWFALFMVLTQFAVVLLRYIYGYENTMMKESIIYMHSFVFMVGAAYTLLYNGHVRVDLFYRDAKPKTKAMVDLFGVLGLLFPVCLLITFSSFGYVTDSWAIMEGSRETSGIPALFLLKTLILVFCFLMMLQGVAMILHAYLVLKDYAQPEQPEHEEML